MYLKGKCGRCCAPRTVRQNAKEFPPTSLRPTRKYSTPIRPSSSNAANCQQPRPPTPQPLQQPPLQSSESSPASPSSNTVDAMPKQSALRSRMDGPRIAAKPRPHANPLDKAGYVLGGTVGVGAYAKVKLATNARSGQKVAIKIVCKRKAPEGYVPFYPPFPFLNLCIPYDANNFPFFVPTANNFIRYHLNCYYTNTNIN